MIDEQTTGWLLRLGGMRPDVPRDVEDRIRRAFLDECRAAARARVVRRRLIAAAAVLSMAAAVVVGVRLGLPREMTPPVTDTVATVERLDGDVTTRRAALLAPVSLGVGARVSVGDEIEVSAASRLGLRLSNGVSVRVDRGSRVRLISSGRIGLDEGAVYIDSGSESHSLEVVTPFGTVRDIGTQFEIRLQDASLRVRVRSGIVDVHHGGDVSPARSGTELTIGAGQVTSRALAPYGQEWAWAESLGPAFAIEGRTLAAFLEHVCREQGWTLAYADATLARQASDIILHGTTAGLQPSDALAVVLRTSGLTHGFANGALEVGRAVRP